jgi:hypothetical protein
MTNNFLQLRNLESCLLWKHTNLLMSCHLVIRNTPEDLPINQCILFGLIYNFVPYLWTVYVSSFVWSELKVLLIQSASQFKQFMLFRWLLNADCNLTVTCSPQTSIIDVCRSTNRSFIINNHQFTMNVNDACHWATI